MGDKNVRYYSDTDIIKRAKKDGRGWCWDPFFPFRKTSHLDPPIDQEEPSEFEDYLRKIATQNLDRIVQEWAEIDEKLYNNCKDAEEKYKNADSSAGSKSSELTKAEGKYEKAKEEFDKQPLPHLSNTAFWIIFLIITSAEIAFNALVFQVFGQTEIHTYIMAVGIMAAIPYISHFIGSKLIKETKSKTDIGMMIGASVILFGGIAVIALLREKFFAANKLVESMGIKWDSNSIVITFMIVNILLFAAMIILSYEAGHRDPDKYKKAKRDLKEAEEELKVVKERLGETDKNLLELKLEFNKAHSERIHKFEKMQYKAKEEKSKWTEGVQLYRSINMEFRMEKIKPKSFNTDIESLIILPKVFETLKCDNCCYLKEDQAEEST